jgi:hypothetical protein
MTRPDGAPPPDDGGMGRPAHWRLLDCIAGSCGGVQVTLDFDDPGAVMDGTTWMSVPEAPPGAGLTPLAPLTFKLRFSPADGRTSSA